MTTRAAYPGKEWDTMTRHRLAADADVRPMRTAISSLRRKLGDDAENPACTFTEPRVGYRMPKGETPGPMDSSTTREPHS